MMSINIANALAKQNIESHLCSTRLEGSLKTKLFTNVEYIYLNKKRTLDIAAIFRLSKYIKNNKIDIVHAHSSSYFLASIIKIFSPTILLVWHDHNGNSEDLDNRKINSIKYFSKYFHAIISVNDLLKSWAKNNLRTNDVYYLPNFAVLNDEVHKTKLKGIEGKRIVCLAGFRPQKDHLTLLKSFKHIQEKYQKWTLHLVGNHYGDAYYQDIKSFIIDNNLDNVVFLYHDSTDIKYVLSQASIAVLSSISEGLPVSLLEYGLARLPVVVTSVGECKQVLKNGRLGLLTPPSDEDELAKSISKLVNDLDLRIQYSNLFYRHVLENYSEEKIIHRLLKIYNS